MLAFVVHLVDLKSPFCLFSRFYGLSDLPKLLFCSPGFINLSCVFNIIQLISTKPCPEGRVF